MAAQVWNGFSYEPPMQARCMMGHQRSGKADDEGQVRRSREAARELGCDGSEERLAAPRKDARHGPEDDGPPARSTGLTPAQPEQASQSNSQEDAFDLPPEADDATTASRPAKKD